MRCVYPPARFVRVLAAATVLAAAIIGTALPAVAHPDRANPFEGVWIWDARQYVPPPGIPSVMHMVSETMSVTHDDGVRYASHIKQVFDTGEVVSYVEDFAEDGLNHVIGQDVPSLVVRISALPDGSRHIVSGRWGDIHDSHCRVSADAMTLTCTGTHIAPDGHSGAFTCVYHRDAPIVPIAWLLRRLDRAG